MKKFILLLRRDFFVTKKRLLNLGKYEKLLILALLIYIAYFSWASFMRFDNFFAGTADLGIPVNNLWNILHGNITFETSGNFFLMLIAPFYFFLPSPKLLIFLQTISLALGAIFVYKLSLRILEKKPISFMFAVSFLLNPSVERTNLYGFHSIVFATTFLLAAFYFMKQKRYGWFLVFALLAGSTGSQVWALLVFYGLFIVVRALYSLRAAGSVQSAYLRKETVFGFVFMMLSLCISVLFLGRFFTGCDWQHYAALISSKDGLLTLTEASRKMYIRELFLPLGYLSLFSPLYLVFASPHLLLNLFSGDVSLRQISFQYTATITPFLFIAAIYGVRLLRYFIPRLSLSFFTVLLIVTTIYGAYLYGPLPFAVHADRKTITKRPYATSMSEYLRRIPKDASVSASSQLVAHLANRGKVDEIPVAMQESQYILFLLDRTPANSADSWQQNQIDLMKNNPNFILVYQQGDFIVFKKNRFFIPK